MTDEQKKSGRRRRPWVWLVGVVVLVGVAVAVWAATRPTAPDPDPEPTPSAQPSGPVAGSYRVAAGEGGTGTAVDGRTPVGYEPTCEGAVHAATNYLVAVDEALVTERTSAEDFAALLDELGAGLDGGAADSPMGDLKAQHATIREESQTYDVPMFTGTSHPEWGGFLVRSCNEGSQAVVDIVRVWEEPQYPPFSTAYRVTLTWFGREGDDEDWRLVEFRQLETDEAPASLGESEATPVPADERRAWLMDAGPGWTEYTNAPQ